MVNNIPIDLKFLDALPEYKDPKMILVTAISPTPKGEGKTTTTVGLGDASLCAALSGHTINIWEVKLCAGAEFIVMIFGDVMTMPGLPKIAVAERICYVNEKVVGLS